MPGSVTEENFKSLRVGGRLRLVRAHGEYLGSRRHGGHNVHLYRIEGFFCEVWMRVGWDAVEWIEIARNPELLSEYVKLDPKDILG